MTRDGGELRSRTVLVGVGGSGEDDGRGDLLLASFGKAAGRAFGLRKGDLSGREYSGT